MIGTILDYETSDANPRTCTPVQTGLLQFNLETWDVIKTFKAYHAVENVQFAPFALAKCGITQKILDKKGKDVKSIVKKTYQMVKESDVVFWHNGAAFDELIFTRLLDEYGKKMPKVIKVDTMKHVNYPDHIKTRALLYLCAEHNFLPKDVAPGGKAHDAMGDCYALWHLLSFYKDQIKDILAAATAKVYRIEACVDRVTNQLAKDRLYRADYQDGKFQGWFKEIRSTDLAREFKEAPFKLAYEGKVLKSHKDLK